MEASINGETALIRASRAGRAETVKMLLEARANTEAVTTDGDTALPLACVHPDIVRMLLDARASMEVSNHDGETALIRASRADSPESVKLLLEARANTDVVTFKYGDTALTAAIYYFRTDVVKLLLDARANMEAVTTDGDTALLLACKSKKTPLLSMLLDARASMEVHNNGETALIRASRAGSPESVKLLLEARANTEAATTVGYAGLVCLDARGIRMEASINGETALIRASRAGRAETVKMLLEARANTEAVTTEMPGASIQVNPKP